MRLRRETGDFQIKINSENAVNTIRKGLSAEDFVGELVNVNGTYEVVNSANDTETGAEFKTNSFTLTYTKASGVITAEEGGSGSGSGSGGGEGGSDTFLIKVTPSESEGTYETDVSFDEIVSATTIGKTIKVQAVSPEGDILAVMPIISSSITKVSPEAPVSGVECLADVSLNVATGSDTSQEITLSATKIRFAKVAAGAPAAMTTSYMRGTIDKNVVSG